MATKKKRPTVDLTAQYRVLSGGISTPSGAVWHAQIVTGADLGDEARVRQLLDKGSIEAAGDDDAE